MLVEDAERYGISQLHQLRGRVGRGEHASLCLLFGPEESPRLRALAEHTRRLRAGRDRPRAARRGRAASARASPASRASASRGCPRTPSCSSARTPAPSALLSKPTPALGRPSTRCSPTRCSAAYGAEALEPDPGVRIVRRAGASAGAGSRAPRGRGDAPDLRPRARGAVLDPRRRSTARACSTCSPGSGALGIEALSRGAATASSSSAPAARSSADPRQPRGARARRRRGACAADARAALRDASRSAVDTYDLVFLDPPYRRAPALGRELSQALARRARARRRVVTESDRRAR